MEDYCKIHLVNGKPVMILITLKLLLEKLPPEKFIRIHRSYVVNLHKIKSFANKKFALLSAELSVSNFYVSSLANWMTNKYVKFVLINKSNYVSSISKAKKFK